jgi:hypothetical protein
MESIIYNNPGTYTSYLQIIGGGCGNYEIDSVTITVNPKPNVTITSISDTICSGNSVTLNANGASSYVWTPGGSTATSISVSPTSNTTYNLEGTAAGCSENASKTIYVETAPTALATSNPSTICAGDNVNFNGTGSSGATTYSWTFPQGSPSVGSSTSPLPIVSFAVAGTHNYSLQVSNSCGTDTYNGTVTINAVPIVVANATATTICSGDPVTLTGSGAASFTWDNGVTDGVAFNPTATATYTVTGTTNGCSNTDQITVTVNASPNVTANASNTTICAGDPVTLTGSGATSYTWDNGVTDGLAFNPTATVTYTVTGFIGSCTDQDQITVTVNPLPNVIANTTSDTICAGDPVTLTGSGAVSYTWDNSVSNGVAFNPTVTTTYTVTGTNGNNCQNTDQVTVIVNSVDVSTSTNLNTITATASSAAYQWIDCNNGNAIIPGEIAQAYTATTNGDYAVIVTQNGCTDTSLCVNITGIGINELSGSTINIYPNPTNDILNISIGKNVVNKITLSDSQGKLVYSLTTMKKLITIDLKETSKGVYFLQVQGENEVNTYKIVKQ